MKNPGKNIAALFDLDPSAIISLYRVNLQDKGEYLFHGGENGYKQKIVFNGLQYDFFPLKAQGFEMHGDGRLPRPKLTMSNHQGTISLRLNYFDDFINYRVTRIKTFVKYLDNVNFPNGINPHAEPDPEAAFTEDVYFINQKTREDDNIVEFELVSILELEGANVPARTVYSNNCAWAYRSSVGCRYNGKPIADGKNMRFVPSGYDGGLVGEDTYFAPGEVSSSEFAPAGTHGYPAWDVLSDYQRGDVVRISSLDGGAELKPDNLYVCLANGTKSSPVYDTENWRLDDCDRSICGCRLRFADAATGAGGATRDISYGKSADEFWTESDEGLPFGGFPGVDPYDYK